MSTTLGKLMPTLGSSSDSRVAVEPRRTSGGDVATIVPPVPTITVVTVVRNGEQTLRRAIDSVLPQLGDEVDCLVIDGNSTDGTRAILASYGDAIRWISEPDRGIYDAMNKALRLARGRWVHFLGADDVAKPVLGAVAAALVEDAVYYGDVEIEATGRISGGRFHCYRLMQENICHQALFYPRSVFERKPYDLDAGVLADHKYNIEVWGSGVRFIHLPQVVTRYNDTGASSGSQAYFDPIKLAAIRASFGPAYYGIKRLRNALVRVWKGRRRGPA